MRRALASIFALILVASHPSSAFRDIPMASMQTISMGGPSALIGFGSFGGGLSGMGGILSLLNLGLGRSGVQLPDTSSLDDALSIGDVLVEAAADAADLILELQDDM
jgi:hypothetical protein